MVGALWQPSLRAAGGRDLGGVGAALAGVVRVRAAALEEARNSRRFMGMTVSRAGRWVSSG